MDAKTPTRKEALLKPALTKVKAARVRVHLPLVGITVRQAIPGTVQLLQAGTQAVQLEVVVTAVGKEVINMDSHVVKNVLEGSSILPRPPVLDGPNKAPVVRLQDGLVLDERIFQQPVLLLGAVGSGKTYLLDRIMEPVLQEADKVADNVVIFCAKDDFLKYRRPGDPLIAVDSSEPGSCWNIFRELSQSSNPELTARDISKSLFSDRKSSIQPFFSNAGSHILFSVLMDMYEDSIKKGTMYSNLHLVDFMNNTTIRGNGDYPSWRELASLRPKYFGHINDYLGDDLELGQGYGVISELTTLIHDCFWGSFASEGSFSAIEALKTGKRIFLYYDHATCSEASIKIFSTIISLLLKHSVSRANGGRRTWFFIDEASLLPKVNWIDAMSLGRQLGFRLCFSLQSASLMRRHYSEDEAMSLLSLFPNIISLRVDDSMSRQVIQDRYGEMLCSYSFSSIGQKIAQHVQERKVVADFDFSTLLQRKGDAICSIPNLSPTAPFLYKGFKEDLT